MINIEVIQNGDPNPFLDPIKCYGQKHGNVYQMFTSKVESNTYFVSTGMHNRVIMIWWDVDQWLLSSASLEDLGEYNPHIKIRQVDAKVTIKLEIE